MADITVKINDYDLWAVNEYNGTYALVNGWENRDGEILPNFCEIKKRDGSKIKVPYGMKGKFQNLTELRNALMHLVVQIDELNRHGDPIPDNDTPF
jgi:hypothetical protein